MNWIAVRLPGVLAFAVAVSSGQDARLSGVVCDPSGALVPAASVTALNQRTGVRRITESNRRGYYSLPALPPGLYRVQAQASGFQITVHEGLKLQVEQNVRLDFKLQVATTRERWKSSNRPPPF
jgi:Carboxypeptidase regulatory-like domain